MPKYVYQGRETGVTFELEQRISDAALTHHPETGEPVKRLIGRPAIAFKGSGFYANDSKGSSAKTSSAKSPEAPASGTPEPAATEKPAAPEKPAQKTEQAAVPAANTPQS